jgi:hypothetical protein
MRKRSRKLDTAQNALRVVDFKTAHYRQMMVIAAPFCSQSQTGSPTIRHRRTIRIPRQSEQWPKLTILMQG